MSTMQQVYLVDDDHDIRDAVRLLLQSVGLSLRSFATAQEFLSAYEPGAGGVLLLDVRMPGMSGLELQQRLRERGDMIPIIIISAHGDVPMTVRAIKAGAIDFVEKPFNEQTLLDRIQEGLDLDQRRRLTQSEMTQVTENMEELTPREKQVMNLLVSGIANKDIAEKLDISRKTLDIHRSKVLQKMKAETVADLVRMVLQLRHFHATGN